MTDLKWSYLRTDRSASILWAGTEVRTIASTNPRFQDVYDYLTGLDLDDVPDEAEVLKRIDAGVNAVTGLQKLSERVAYQNGTLYFDGDPLDNAISRHIAAMVQRDDRAYESFVRFLENLALNPSKRARRELFGWVNQANLTITKDGRFLAYKGVRNEPENRSISAGVEKVWVDGVEHTGNIPNPIGAVIEMARSEVNDNKEVACSKGLHAGTYNYASNFGQKLLLVAINPRDVVSVPNDSSFQKLRVCRYEVLALGNQQIEDTTYAGSHRWEGEPLTEDNQSDEDKGPILCPVCDNVEVTSEDDMCENCAYEADETDHAYCPLCEDLDCD